MSASVADVQRVQENKIVDYREFNNGIQILYKDSHMEDTLRISSKVFNARSELILSFDQKVSLFKTLV